MGSTPDRKQNGVNVGDRPAPGAAQDSDWKSPQASDQLRDILLQYAGAFPVGWDAHPGYLEVAAWPSETTSGLVSRDALRRALLKAAGSAPHHAFCVVPEGERAVATESGYKSASTGETNHIHWQILRSGTLYQRTALAGDLAAHGSCGSLSLDEIIAYVVQAVDAAGAMYNSLLSPDDTVTLRFRITDMASRTLVGADDIFCCPQSELVYSTTQSVADMKERRGSIVGEVVRDLLQQFGWDDPPTSELRGLADRHITAATYRRYR